MGLDQYAYRTSANLTDFPFIEDSEKIPRELYAKLNDPETSFEIAYWRKHANLQGWMEALYRERGGTQSFNCVDLPLSLEDIERLEKDVLASALPHTTVFFFGESAPEDRENDLKFIALAKEIIAEGDFIYYSSWW